MIYSEIQKTGFFPNALTLAMVAWDAQPGPWTTEEYAFFPFILPGSVDGVSTYPEGTNWTVSTIGVRGTVECQTLETPRNFFQPLPVVNSENMTVAIGWEIHDWQDGPETTNEQITYSYGDVQTSSTINHFSQVSKILILFRGYCHFSRFRVSCSLLEDRCPST
jgi:hypothetical protein